MRIDCKECLKAINADSSSNGANDQFTLIGCISEHRHSVVEDSDIDKLKKTEKEVEVFRADVRQCAITIDDDTVVVGSGDPSSVASPPQSSTGRIDNDVTAALTFSNKKLVDAFLLQFEASKDKAVDKVQLLSVAVMLERNLSVVEKKMRGLEAQLVRRGLELQVAIARQKMSDDHQERFSSTANKLVTEMDNRLESQLAKQKSAIEEKNRLTQQLEHSQQLYDEAQRSINVMNHDNEALRQEIATLLSNQLTDSSIKLDTVADEDKQWFAVVSHAGIAAHSAGATTAISTTVPNEDASTTASSPSPPLLQQLSLETFKDETMFDSPATVPSTTAMNENIPNRETAIDEVQQMQRQKVELDRAAKLATINRFGSLLPDQCHLLRIKQQSMIGSIQPQCQAPVSVFAIETSVAHLHAIALDADNGDLLMIEAATRLVRIWGSESTTTIGYDRLQSIATVLDSANATRFASQIDESTANRLQLIEAIVVDDGDARWLDLYAKVVCKALAMDSKVAVNDHRLRRRIYGPISKAIRSIFGDSTWSRMSWQTTVDDDSTLLTAHRIAIVCAFGSLLFAYRHEASLDDMLMFRKRFDTMQLIQPSNADMKVCADQMQQYLQV